MDKPVILASASPRRQELMSLITTQFTVEVSEVEELIPEGLSLAMAPEYLAELKAKDVAARHPDQLVIGGDTGVFIETEDGMQMLGKPHTEEEAKKMLRLLSGRRHVVRTGCCICRGEQSLSFTEEAVVEFYPLSEQEISDYIATGEPMDKAGSYGVQGYGALLIKRIEGDFYTIMGLPVARLKRELRKCD